MPPNLYPTLCILPIVAAALFIQYRLSETGISPVAVVLPPLPEFPIDNRLTGKVEKIGENDLVGPESLVSTYYGTKEVMFATLGDGRIVRIEEENSVVRWTSLARTGTAIPLTFEEEDINKMEGKCGKGGPGDMTNTESLCGRPLGIKIVKRSSVDPTLDGDDEDVLVVADSYHGLLMISGIYGENAKLRILATRANTDDQGYRFHLLNALVQTPDGALYITETSTSFSRRRIFHAIMDGKPTGRLLKYTKERGVEVLVDKLLMPNGIAISHNGQDLLIVAAVQILRYSLERNKITPEPFVRVLPGTGDNIDRFDHLPSGKKCNCYWAGLGSKFARPFSLLKALSEKPVLKAIICAFVPYEVLVNLIPKLSALAVYGEDGELIEIYQDSNAAAPWVSEGETMGGFLYIGSWFNPFLARVKITDLEA